MEYICRVWGKQIKIIGWFLEMEKKILFVDLDGTLLDDNKDITPGNLEAIQKAADQGHAVVITTGGQGRDEWVPEGQAMRNYLIEKGLDSQRVLAECKSTSTEENFLFAKEILVQQGISAQEPVVYVTNAFHCYRGGVYAAMAGFTTAHALPAGIPLRSVLTCYLREAAAVIYYWLFKSSRTGFMQPLVGLLSLNKKFFYK